MLALLKLVSNVLEIELLVGMLQLPTVFVQILVKTDRQLFGHQNNHLKSSKQLETKVEFKFQGFNHRSLHNQKNGRMFTAVVATTALATH